MFYGAMVLQMVSYAALIPATVHFSNDQVAEADRNKGQAVFAASSTIAMLLSSFLGGLLFQFLDTRFVIAVGVVASIAGTALMIVGIRDSARHTPATSGVKVRMRR